MKKKNQYTQILSKGYCVLAIGSFIGHSQYCCHKQNPQRTEIREDHRQLLDGSTLRWHPNSVTIWVLPPFSKAFISLFFLYFLKYVFLFNCDYAVVLSFFSPFSYLRSNHNCSNVSPLQRLSSSPSHFSLYTLKAFNAHLLFKKALFYFF